MKLILSVAGCAVLCLAAGRSAFTQSPSPQALPKALRTLGASGISLRAAMVRVEYYDRSGNHDHTDTICHIANASLASPITMGDIYVLGAGGVQSLMATYPGLSGTSIPPLGKVQLAIDNRIPGVRPQTNANAPSIVQHVVVSYYGPSGAVDLTSVITQQATGSDDNRTKYLVPGVDLTP